MTTAMNQNTSESSYLRSKGVINPYRMAASLVKHRLLWDLRPVSWISRKKMRSWKNRYSGEKCVILCNGPSLLKVDFEALQQSGLFTFGLNKINLLFEKESFRPSCIVAVNPYVIEQNSEFYNQTSIPLFLSSRKASLIKLRNNIVFFYYSAIKQFAKDCSWGISSGCTVTYVAMQLAFHMGFRHVALVGCDHSFASKGMPNQAVVSGDTDPNHFDPRYFSGGVKWQLPDLIGSEFSYSIAGRHFEAYGGEIVNCTDGGKLEVFRRCSMEEFVRS